MLISLFQATGLISANSKESTKKVSQTDANPGVK